MSVLRSVSGDIYRSYSPKCLEGVSVLKNSFALSSAPVLRG
jgi:hypothetical protein